MRVRSVVIPVAIAVTAAVATPTAASAAVECGLIVPKKVIIDANAVMMPMTLTSGCFTNGAEYANWDYIHSGGAGAFEVDFGTEDLQRGNRDFGLTWYDDIPAGTWHLDPNHSQAGDTELSQNFATTQVQFGSKLTADVTRSRTKLTWAATATVWSGPKDRYVARPATIAVFHQAKTGAPWTYVTSVKAARDGKATVSVSAPKSGNYRLAIAETRTVAAAYSRTIKGRV
jgi:hypothetical protein